MKEASRTLCPQTLKESSECIFSLESGDGTWLCELQGGPKDCLFGLAPAHANHTPAPVKAKGMPTKGTSGPRCSGSSESAVLQSSLENRLHQLLDTVGSMEYRQTWKEKATPSGRRYLVHTASGHRTSDKDCTGWPTTTAQMSESGYMISGKPNLLGEARMAGWPKTPSATDGEGGTFDMEIAIANGKNPKAKLRDWAKMAGWATTTTRDSKSEGKDGDNRTGTPSLPAQILGAISESAPAKTGNSGVLDHRFSLWLMGFPPDWDREAPGSKEWNACQQAAIESAASKGVATPSSLNWLLDL